MQLLPMNLCAYWAELDNIYCNKNGLHIHFILYIRHTKTHVCYCEASEFSKSTCGPHVRIGVCVTELLKLYTFGRLKVGLRS